MARWTDYSVEEKQAIGSAFELLCISDWLSVDETEVSDVPTHVLGRYANDRDFQLLPQHLESLARYPEAQQKLDAMLRKDPVCRFDESMAAGTPGGLVRWESGPFVIEVGQRDVDVQALIVVVVAGAPPPSALFVQTPSGAVHKRKLSPPQEGQIQFFADEGSELLEALRDSAAKVTLR